MRSTLITLTFLTCASALEGLNETPEDSWTGRDKAEHALGGFLVGAVATFLADEMRREWPRWKKVTAGVAASALVGALKEVADSRDPENHDASQKDFACTTAGGVLGSVAVAWVFHF